MMHGLPQGHVDYKWQSWLTTSLSNPKPTIFLPHITFHHKSQGILPLVGCWRWMASRSSLLWKELVFLRDTHIAPFFPGLPSTGSVRPADMVFSPTGCVLVVSVIEQLAQIHNSTVQASMERLCSYLPGKYGNRSAAESPRYFLLVGHHGPSLMSLHLRRRSWSCYFCLLIFLWCS